MKRRRVIQLVLLLLVGGAIVNPTVPLGFGFFGDSRPDAEAIALWQTRSVDGWPPSPLAGVLTCHLWYDEQSWYHNGFGTIMYSPTATLSELRETFEGIGRFAVTRVRCGSPLRTLQWDSWNGVPNAPAGVFSPTVGNDGLTIGNVLIPRTPIWPGFAINTIFYAAILWAVFFAPGMMKRTLRFRRGLCPACAYPVGASDVCTECGSPLPRVERAATDHSQQREGEGLGVRVPPGATVDPNNPHPNPVPSPPRGEGIPP